MNNRVLTKLTSSNNNSFPFIKASTKSPSINVNHDQSSLFKINPPIKSSIIVYELKFNLIILLFIINISHRSSIDFVFDILVSPFNYFFYVYKIIFYFNIITH